MGDRWLLKLHGTIERPDSLVFTRAQYINSFSSNRALVGLVQSMLMTRHMLFVGYGLRDEDFHELVHEVRSALGHAPTAREKRGTVLALFDDKARSDLWDDFVEILPMRPRPEADVSDEEYEREFQLAVRDLERYLDLLGMLSVDTSLYVLDPTYSDPGSTDREEAHQLSELLKGVLTEFDNQRQGKPSLVGTSQAWTEVRRLLRKFGANV